MNGYDADSRLYCCADSYQSLDISVATCVEPVFGAILYSVIEDGAYLMYFLIALGLSCFRISSPH